VEGSDRISEVHTVTVDPSLKFKDVPTNTASGAGFTVTGYIRPKHVKGAQDVAVRFYLDGVLRKTVSATNADYTASTGEQLTKFSVKTSLKTAGRWTVTAYLPGDDVHNEFETLGSTLYVNRPTLSMSTNRNKVQYNTPATLSGTLKARSGAVMKYRTVYLERSDDAGKTWNSFKKLKTNSKGRVSYTVKPENVTYFRFRFAGETNHLPRTSTSEKIVPTRTYQWVEDTLKGDSQRYGSTPDYYLSAGKHRIRISASRGLYTVWVSKSDNTWGMVDTDNVPANTSTTYYVTVPRSGNYYVEVENSKTGVSYGNDIYIEVW
jgi:hypothetical protein